MPTAPGTDPADEHKRILEQARAAGTDPKGSAFGGDSLTLGKKAQERYQESYNEYQGHFNQAATNLSIMIPAYRGAGNKKAPGEA
jgi:hypothetical protein